MHIPTAFFWLLSALAALQLFHAARALPRALRAGPGARTGPWLAFTDHVLSVPLTVGLALGNLTVAFYGTLLLGPVLTWSLIRGIRSAGAPKAAQQPGTP